MSKLIKVEDIKGWQFSHPLAVYNGPVGESSKSLSIVITTELSKYNVLVDGELVYDGTSIESAVHMYNAY